MKRIITNQMVLSFEKQLLADEKSKNTIEKYLRDLKTLREYMLGKEIEKQSVINFKSSLLDNYEVSSANSIIAAVNAFFKFMKWNDFRIKQFKVQKKTFCSEDKELTKAEYARLVHSATRRGNERLELILQTICGTGIRVSELQFITVEAVQKGKATVSCKNKIRTVFFVRKLQKKLLKYAKRKGITTGCLFTTKSGKPISRANIWREMKALCVDAKVSPNKVYPHNLRHLFARTFYEAEKDIAKLADILGHSSINTTRFYIITSGNEHRQRMENMRLII